MQKIFMWGLPAITVIFTWWLPAALQLSFFVSGVLSYGQSSLFKWGRFREWAKMTPLDPIPSSSTPTPSVYKGEMKVRAPLTTAELDKSFQEGRKTGILDLAKKRVESVVDPIAKVAKKGNNFVGGLDERRAKAEKQTRDAYEKRRSKEVQQERRQERMEKARLKREKRASK
jgi:YidC/Oxa1 family membrane protein insertase